MARPGDRARARLRRGSRADYGAAVTSHRAASLTRSAVVLAAATTVANLLGYVLVLLLTRSLSAQDLGAAGALLNLAVIGMVPAVALQLVVARAVAGAPAPTPDGVPQVEAVPPGAAVRVAVETGLLLCVLVAVAAPALERFLRLDGPWAALLVGAWLLPATVVFAAQGLLQGRERFLALSAVLVLAAAARPLGGAVEAVTGAGVTALMGFVAAGTAVAALVALRLVGEPLHVLAPAARAAAGRLRGPLAGAAVTTAGLLTLANVDLLLARHVLDPAASGSYAVGALFAKGAFWAPQFVSTLLYPRMAQPGRRSRAVVGAVGICTAVGVGAVLVTLALGGPLVTVVAGSAYRPLGPSLWLFAALGGALAVAQVLLYARLAVGDRTIGAAAWLCIAGLAVAVLLDPAPTVAGVAARALAATLVLVGIGLVVERAAFRRGPDRASAVTAG